MNEPLLVLMIEDSATDAKLVALELQRTGREIRVERVESAGAMRDALRRGPWNIVISDWSLPSFGARAALTLLQEEKLDLPFIIVSGTIGEEAAVDAMRAGAHDYVLKDKLGRLLPAVERELRECKARAVHRESEARTATMVESALDAIIGMDHAGMITEWNAAAERVFGYSRIEAVGKELAALIIPEGTRAAHRTGLERFLAVGTGPLIGRRVEIEAVRRDGVLFPVEVAITQLGSKSESSFMGFVRDISERTQAERARKASETRYRRIVETTNQGVWLTDLDGRTTFMNARMASMLGYERDEVIGISARTFVDDESREVLSRYLAESGSRAVHVERILKRKDGTTVCALFEVASTFAESGTRDGSFAMVMDMTERNKSEAALRQSEADKASAQSDVIERVQIEALTAEAGLALALGASLPDILRQCAAATVSHLGVALVRIWMLNQGTNVMELQASAGIDGIAPGGMTGGKFDIALIANERQPYFTNEFATDAINLDREWAEREGIVCFAAHPLLVAGHLIGVVDLCARRPLSDAVRKGLGTVAGAVAVGIQRKLAEEAGSSLETQLRQAQKMEAVGRLAGGIAHDFNNLLSVILSYAELILDDLAPGNPLRGDIAEIHQAGARAADLTRQLLMFSRQQVIEPRVLDLNDVLAGTDNMLRRLVGEDIELTSIPAATLGRIRADRGSMDQVLMNLAVNARDAMPKGGKLTMETANVELDEAYARTHVGAKAGPHVMLSVTDTGIGMDKATQARIFEPFFTTKETGKGTGLGLSTVFGIVQQSGGNIWVYSEPGIGTTFKVYLPCVDASVDGERTGTEPTTLRGDETILLVEDEEQVRTVACGILRRHGYLVLEASNALEALTLCNGYAGAIHLLLSDVVMPGMSGPELSKRLARSRPDMKLLCMSGYTDDSAIRHGVIDAPFAYLQKPLTVASLTKKVRAVLESAQREA